MHYEKESDFHQRILRVLQTELPDPTHMKLLVSRFGEKSRDRVTGAVYTLRDSGLIQAVGNGLYKTTGGLNA